MSERRLVLLKGNKQHLVFLHEAGIWGAKKCTHAITTRKMVLVIEGGREAGAKGASGGAGGERCGNRRLMEGLVVRVKKEEKERSKVLVVTQSVYESVKSGVDPSIAHYS